MTKAELIEKVHATSGENKAAVERVLDGGSVALPGIGKFEVKTFKARKGRNPKTGKELTIPAGRRVAFSVAKNLKDILKG